jgi:hypothetical protein
MSANYPVLRQGDFFLVHDDDRLPLPWVVFRVSGAEAGVVLRISAHGSEEEARAGVLDYVSSHCVERP